MTDNTTKYESLSFYKELFAKLNAVIYTLNLKTQTYTWGTERYFDIFGYADNEIIKNAKEFAARYFHPDDKYLLKERIKSFIKKETTSWSGVYRIKHKEGHWVWVFSKVTVFEYDELGNPKVLLGIVMDATEGFNTPEQMTRLYKDSIRNRNNIFIEKLTNRELEVIKLTAKGDSYREIAKKLNIKPDTVNKHRKNILVKLDLKNIACLVFFAKDTGLA